MVETLTPLTPLGGTAPREDSFPGLRLRERCDRALASVAARRGREAEVAQALERLAGCPVPGPGGLAAGPAMTLFWTAPQQWFLDAPLATHEDIAERAKAVLGDTASVTEQTGGWARFDLDGPGCLAVLERLVPLDLAMLTGPGAARTLAEHMGVFVLCHEPGRAFSVIGARSSAASLHHALTTAAGSAL